MTEVQEIRSVLQESFKELDETREGVDAYRGTAQDLSSETAEIITKIDELYGRVQSVQEQMSGLEQAHGQSTQRVNGVARSVGSIASGSEGLREFTAEAEKFGAEMGKVTNIFGAGAKVFEAQLTVLGGLKEAVETGQQTLASLADEKNGLPAEASQLGAYSSTLKDYDQTIGQSFQGKQA